MAFVESLEADEPTHRIVTRRAARLKDWDESGGITVENSVVDVVAEYGDAVHLQLSDESDRLEGLRSRLERVDASDAVFAPSRAEYRASLPADRDVVRSALAVEPSDTDGWIARLFHLEEFAVLAADGWLYRSVPHHAHVREVDASGREAMLAAIAAELESVPRSGVVPVDGFASWRTGEYRYRLTWDALRRTAAGGEGRWTSFDLDRLRSVSIRPAGPALALDWEPSSADSWSRRILRRATDPGSVDPPTRLELPDRDVLSETVESLRTLRTDLGYRFAIEERS